tara:strand:- start:638 stop:829 length:192 start_codon:yes stop_codon:yes gene_type:complete
MKDWSLLNIQAQQFAPNDVDRVAAMMNSSHYDDWSYKVKHDPKGIGFSLIEIYDEGGEFVSYL